MSSHRSAARDRPRRISFLTYERGNGLDLTGPVEVFAAANMLAADRQPAEGPPYEIEVLAPHPHPVRMASGLRVVPDCAYPKAGRGIDTLIVCGGDPSAVAIDAELLAWLRETAPRVRRLASVCTGAFILAEAGLLDGRRATTHWRTVDLLASYESIRVDPDALYVRDGNVYTSAGVTAGMDLALALIEEDLGHKIALDVARALVLFLKRPGGQSQFSSYLAAQSRALGSLSDLTDWILDHLSEDLTIEALAKRAAMSPRNFARVFVKETGLTPAKFVERARVDRARRRLEDSGAPIETVARECGFGNAERMRRTFRRHLRVVPQDYRRRFVAVRPTDMEERR